MKVSDMYEFGDRNAVFSYSDYLEAWSYLDGIGEEPVEIYATSDALIDMKTDTNLIQKQDLLVKDVETNVVTRYALYREWVDGGIGLYDGVPVYKWDRDGPNKYPLAKIVGDGGTEVVVKG